MTNFARLTRIFAVLGMALGAAAATQAADAPVVVELYTSQGCSSCPPADEAVAELARRDDVIALALHVDYWDYIGWKDTFAQPDFAGRQRGYASVAHRRMVYTPQMIFNGRQHVEGAGPGRILDTLSAARLTDAAPVRLERQGDRLSIRAPAASFARPVKVQLFRYMPSEKVRILRGENRGRTITYTNIVTQWTILDTWDGRAPLDISTPVPGDEGIAVVLQYAGPGKVVGAAQIR